MIAECNVLSSVLSCALSYQVANSTITNRNLVETALATFLDGTPFHEFGQWLIDQRRCVFRVDSTVKVPGDAALVMLPP